MAKKIDSIKHNKDKRAHIPSKEEAGYEQANVKVQQGNKFIEFPKNPIVHRGQDPELFWLNKYGNDDREDLLKVDIRSLYRHEHIAPETLIKNLYRIVESDPSQLDMFSINELFGNALNKDELDKVSDYYKHQDGWTNRLIQGDSLLVMSNLLEREGMAGQIQTIYIDPPYGIKYGSNWQIKLNDKDMPASQPDEAISGEPEVIKAFRDTWEFGIHSYLSYLRDRLLIAKELLTESGSCFLQISNENIHLVRSIMDEIFGSGNFISLLIIKKKTSPQAILGLFEMNDYILWYSKDKSKLKFRQLFVEKKLSNSEYKYFDLGNNKFRSITNEDLLSQNLDLSKVYRTHAAVSKRGKIKNVFPLTISGKNITPPTGYEWETDEVGMKKLITLRRLIGLSPQRMYKIYYNDFPVSLLANTWSDLLSEQNPIYVVQTTVKIIQRCLLMSTDPGDLVLDPTCGSGTTAFVAEQFGRRWITIDTSRIALNIAKQRLLTAVYPYYKLYDEQYNDIRQGFIYKTVPHITLKSLADDEPAVTETLFDQPEEDKKKLRVSGPFTVETLQNFEPVNPADLQVEKLVNEETGEWEEKIKMHLLSTGVKNGRKEEWVKFTRVDLLANPYLNAEGFYQTSKGEYKAYFLIGPRFGTVSKSLVNESVKECRSRGDANWLVILGFSFESDIEGGTKTMSVGTFEVTKSKIHDDLLQEGLKKKPSKMAASFVTIGEPDIKTHTKGKEIIVEILGLDIYDPIKDEVKPRNVSEIAYWTVDDNYDGSNFVVKQVFFCGGDKDEFEKWKKGLSDLAKNGTKRNVEKTLKIEIDDEAFDSLYGYKSHPIKIIIKDQKIAVRIISLYGEETTKVIQV